MYRHLILIFFAFLICSPAAMAQESVKDMKRRVETLQKLIADKGVYYQLYTGAFELE